MHKHNQERIEIYLDYKEQGYTDQHIADVLGIKHNTLQQIIKRSGIVVERKAYYDTDLKRWRSPNGSFLAESDGEMWVVQDKRNRIAAERRLRKALQAR